MSTPEPIDFKVFDNRNDPKYGENGRLFNYERYTGGNVCMISGLLFEKQSSGKWRMISDLTGNDDAFLVEIVTGQIGVSTVLLIDKRYDFALIDNTLHLIPQVISA